MIIWSHQKEMKKSSFTLNKTQCPNVLFKKEKKGEADLDR